MYINLCENIGIFIKNYKSTNLGQIKLCMDPVNKNPKKKIQNFDFSICKILLLRKKMASRKKKKNITPLCISND